MLLPYTVLLRFQGFLHPTTYPMEQASLFYKTFFYWLHGNPLVEQIEGVFVVFIQAVWINRIVIRHRLSSVITLFSGVFYILLVSLTPGQLGLSPVLIAGFVFIAVLPSMLRIYLVKQAAGDLFNYGFGMALAGLIYPSYFVVMLSALPGIAILRSIKLKEILQWMGGVIAVVFFGGLSFSMWGMEEEFFSGLLNWNGALVAGLRHLNVWNGLYLFIMGFAILVVFLNTQVVMRNIAYKERKKWKVLFWVLAFAVLSVFFAPGLDWYPVDIIAVPLSMALGTIASKTKNNLLLEIVHVLLLIGILFLHSTIN